MLKIEQNWGKIASYPPNAQNKSAPLAAQTSNFSAAGNWKFTAAINVQICIILEKILIKNLTKHFAIIVAKIYFQES